ncbi:GGDEF domain-containing protein [Balneatrix alpica]|uniref:diguanylate cyclase n=1 Tax=Balneatrix alpica TaxID=75684 RepID=A0ABV5Z9Q3_9GAMM|nr:GGDEF domain-containing protein [Balneatrix alpica]
MSKAEDANWKGKYYDLLSELNELELGLEKRIQLQLSLCRKLVQLLAVQDEGNPHWPKLQKVLQQAPDEAVLQQWLEQIDVPVPVGAESAAARKSVGIEPLEAASTAASDAYMRLRTWLLEKVRPLLDELKEYPSLGQLLQQLQHHQTPEQIEQTLQTMLLTLLEQLGKQDDLVAYLEDINKHLQSVQQFVGMANTQQQEASAERQRFDQNMKRSMQGLQQDVRQAVSLDTLKTQVEGRLGQLSQTLGEFKLQQDARAQHWQQRCQQLEQQMQQLSADHASLQTKMQQQEHKIQTDNLTGLPNRSAYEVRLQQLILDNQRKGLPFALVVADLDHFKGINDQYGHLAGDKVLKIIAKALRNQLRREDMLARFGGEEFVLLLPGLSLLEAAQVAEKLRQAAMATGFHFRGSRVQVTVSLGVASYRQGEPVEELFERADQALYEAKHSGRNRVSLERVTDKA